ncbi:hypothetical protein AGOR_G00012690 [Albula goreensis]|uniref:EGF-like domain-containing protein n=1 Tax=Albula goreensis TaxID=1534307 RepID=A0A8T3E753_9TELE|nr:hypothetical protein AGOR_G00012690 [Albula goreensis]
METAAAMPTSTPLVCDKKLCQDHGECLILNGETSCECRLGYRGTFCEDRVSDPIRVPLSLGVLGVLGGIILLAFMFMLIRKKRKAYNRKLMSESKKINMASIDNDLP